MKTHMRDATECINSIGYALFAEIEKRMQYVFLTFHYKSQISSHGYSDREPDRGPTIAKVKGQMTSF